MAWNPTPGLFLRPAFYLAFGAFFGATFLNGWGAVIGAVLVGVIGIYISKMWLVPESFYAGFSKLQKDYDKFITPLVISPSFLTALFLFGIDSIFCHSLYIFSIYRLPINNPEIYSLLTEAFKPGADAVFTHYSVLNDLFAVSSAERVLYLKTSIFGIFLINGVLLCRGVLGAFIDAPKYFSWVQSSSRHRDIDAALEIRFMSGIVGIALISLIAWLHLFGKGFVLPDTYLYLPLKFSGSVEYFSSGLYAYSIHIFIISLTSVLFVNLALSSAIVFYFIVRKQLLALRQR